MVLVPLAFFPLTLFNQPGMRIGYNSNTNVSFIDPVGNWFAIRGDPISNPNDGGCKIIY